MNETLDTVRIVENSKQFFNATPIVKERDTENKRNNLSYFDIFQLVC